METRLLRRETPFALARWGDTLDKFFEDFWSPSPEAAGQGLLAPSMDVSEDQNSIHVNVELPGIERKDIALEIKDGVLTIRGEKKQDEEIKDRNYHRIERRYGSFYRALSLPETVEGGKVDARFKDGVLHVTLPKREETKPRAIAIKE